jgi:hypothetical protein
VRLSFIGWDRAAVVLVAGLIPAGLSAQLPSAWPQHSMERPKPPAVNPGPFPGSTPAPSDATVLFDGTSLALWRLNDSLAEPAKWKVGGGYMEVVPGSGGIRTAAGFGDAQVHVEWSSPALAEGSGQDRGNSGVFMMGQYEVQVLDSHGNETYADGQAGSVYGQYPPLVNPIRPPGEWNSYDIVFHRPRFDAAGKVEKPATMTVFFNGVLVQDGVVLVGPTSNQERRPYTAHADRLPLSLQDHGHRVRFQNIWIRTLE